MFIIIVFDKLVIGRQDFIFVRAHFTPFENSILTPLFSSSFILSYFILADPMHECLGKHSCMSSTFPITMLIATSFFPTVQLQVPNVYL